MIRRYLILGNMVFWSLWARAQHPLRDSVIRKVQSTDIELVYNQYLQNGHNSAVTGGIGTEALQVYGPQLNLKYTGKYRTYSANVGADVITSASTDNIDYVISSASRTDTRTHANMLVEKSYLNGRFSLHGGGGFSIESDYFSLGGRAGLTIPGKKGMNEFTADFIYYDDDLRWGRLNDAYKRPEKLVYPVSLRYKEWYNQYKRYSYNLKVSFTQILNKRNILALYPMATLQTGLLATPFHLIVFSDDTKGVEQMPNSRFKTALSVRLNSFLGGRVIMKNKVDGYRDTFGVNAISFENETVIKLSPINSIAPGIRVYTQTAANFFAGYAQHDSSDKYYTSDYDYSQFESYQAGIAFKHKPYKKWKSGRIFNGFTLRYSYYYRTTQLHAHMMTLVLQSAGRH